MRIYDKGAEEGSEAPGQKWRWELQLRRTRARAATAQLAAAPSRTSVVAGLVLGHIFTCGLRSPALGAAPLDLQAEKIDTDATDTMRWLSEGVRPAVDRLKGWYTKQELREALGLD